MLIDMFQSTFACITCHSPLTRDGETFRCLRCGVRYPIRDGTLWAVSPDTLIAYERETKASFESRWKRFLRRFPRLYLLLAYLFAPGGVPGGLAVRHALRLVPPETHLIVNLGSGSKRVRRDILNLDVVPVAEVDIVADMAELPFRDGSLDMVISECALEHVPRASRAISEIARVVRPGGFVYVVVPFLYPFHEAPNDYFRWTKAGLCAEFSDFEPIEVGVWSGPMSTLIGYVSTLFAAVFSFGSDRLAVVLTYAILIPLAPLKLLDLLFRPFPRISDVSAVLYFFGRRKTER